MKNDDGYGYVFTITTEAASEIPESSDLETEMELEDDPFKLASEFEISSGEVLAMEASSYAINWETNTSNTREWMMDTSASDHTTGDRSAFLSYRAYKPGEIVGGAN